MAFEIVHEFSWSVSRAGNFAACRRRYYFDYYLSWRGWERQAPEQRKRAYLLKKMTRMPMWAGDCLHQALEHWFKERQGGRDLSAQEVCRFAVNKFREGYVQSRDGEWRKRPAKLTHLAEHHYKEERIDEESGRAGEYGKRYVERIESAVKAFFGMPELERVRRVAKGDALAFEEMGTIELCGEKVYAIPDFALREPNEGGDLVWIYDWKTGQPRPQDEFQLMLYVHYGKETWGADPMRVRTVDAYLPQQQVIERSFSPDELAQCMARVEGSMVEMRAIHFNADDGTGDAEAFPKIPLDSPEARACSMCNYRELCERS